MKYREQISAWAMGKPREVQSAAFFKIRLTDLYYCASSSSSFRLRRSL